MKCMGRLFRHFNDGVPDYDDLFVKNWLISRGEDLEYYSHYDVVIPKREYARTALARYDRPEDPFSDDVKRFYDIAGEWLWHEFGEHMGDSKISSNDAVEQHLRDDKSPGAPWNLIGVLSKGDYFSNYAEFYAKYWDLLATPNYIRSLCSSSIKEELRTTEKVRNGQVRTIISMDVNHVKAHCQLTLDQNERLMATVGKHSSCIGLVQQYGGWNALDRRMSAFGPLPCTLELDGKQFDARFRYYCFQKIRNFRFRCLRREYRTTENWIRFHNLYRELCFGFFVDADGHVYCRRVGNPSGQACTTPDNMLKNFMDIVVLWHLIMPETYHSYRDFHNLLILCIVGDDVNVSVHPSIQHIFNAKAIFNVMHKIDMEYTTPCMDFRHNRDCEFLSHGFEECLGMMLPVIDCRKMRTSMLKFNTSGKISETIVRACGLRNETFACVHCRDWFSELLHDLRHVYGDSCDRDIISAWKSYKTDAELWSLYTGLKYSDVCVALASASRSPEYKFARRYLQSKVMTQSKKKVKKAAKKVAVKEVKKILKGKRTIRKSRRKGNTLHGKGGYWGDLGKRLGGHVGGVADEVLGVGKALTGVGSYHVKSNTVYESGGPPAIVNSKHASRVRHQEYICDVYGSTNFSITQFSINPGVVRTFPWLHSSAQGYEQYKVHGMVFEFRSTSATAIGSTNTALGTVIMATEYNSNLPPFINKQQMENHEYTTAVCPDHNALHPIECARSRTAIDELYVRSSNATGSTTSYPAGYNPLLYDLGQFYIATVGMQAGVTIIGELWVSYEIEFLKPAQSLANANGAVTHYYYDSTLGSAPSSGAAMANLRNKFTGAYLSSTSNGFTSLPVGRFILSVSGIQSSTSSTVPTITYSGGSGISMLNTTAATGVSTTSVIGIPNSTGALTTFQWLYTFEISDPSNSFAFGSFTSGTISSMDVFLIPYPPGFTMAESRKAVDWDPIAVLSRKVMELESRLSSVAEEEDEKYFDSECSTPVDIEPVSRSTADLAESLLAKIGRRSAVTDKTAVSRLQ